MSFFILVEAETFKIKVLADSGSGETLFLVRRPSSHCILA